MSGAFPGAAALINAKRRSMRMLVNREDKPHSLITSANSTELLSSSIDSNCVRALPSNARK